MITKIGPFLPQATICKWKLEDKSPHGYFWNSQKLPNNFENTLAMLENPQYMETLEYSLYGLGGKLDTALHFLREYSAFLYNFVSDKGENVAKEMTHGVIAKTM